MSDPASFSLNPESSDLWFLPLGGCGEIGMNLNLFGHDGQWLMVDCGVTFEDEKIAMADPQFIEARQDSLVGIIVTHIHQDHIGALPDLWDRLRAPVYTTRFTAKVVDRAFAERGMLDVPIVVVETGDCLDIGAFEITWLPITHSTPETHALQIRTSAGSILHTADWKIDETPVVGIPFKRETFAGLKGIDAVVCDSTNATMPGASVSEAELFKGLQDCIAQATGRVVVSCFASNIARLQTLADIASITHRYIAVMGRSMRQLSEAAKSCGYLNEAFNPTDPDHLGYLPRNEVMAIASGNQGDVGSALYRLALDTHPDLNLDAGDLVVLSAKTIPGNEENVDRLVELFEQRDIRVILADNSNAPLHATGHPQRDELIDMYELVEPELAIPVHGEPVHMQANADIARGCGVPEQLVGENGDLFVIAGEGAPYLRSGAVKAGRLCRR